TLNTLCPRAAITIATAMMMQPTPKVATQPTTSFSDSPARRGKRVGRMSFEMIEAWMFSRPEMLDMVALNMAASMMPTRPLGSRVSAAKAYDDSWGLASPGQTDFKSGYSARIARGGTNQMKAPS